MSPEGEVAAAASAGGSAALSLGLRTWLGRGGCQGPTGAFHAWREEESGRLSFEYPEITGYALTYLSHLEAPEEHEIRAATRAGDWLVDRLETSGDLSARTDWDSGAIYNFDVAMIASGLLNAGRAFDRGRYIDLGVRLAGGLADQIDGRGRVPAVASGIQSARSGWSVDGEAHMLKALQCFLLGEEAGSDALGEKATRMAASVGELQEENGRFRTQREDEVTMLHPHLYTVEGLWIFATARGDQEALEQARAGAAWAWEQQLASGGFPRFVAVREGGETAPEQFDLTAQALRAACLFDLDSTGRERAAERLGEVARSAEDGLALPYQPSPQPIHHNAWVSMFAAQATSLAAGEAELGWEALV